MLNVARSIDVAGLPTRYFETGTGTQHLLFIHGGARSGLICSTALAWDLNFNRFAETFRTLALDIPGHSATACAGENDGPLYFAVEHLAAFIKATALRKPHLVGHDEGGLAALYFALKQPELVGSVTLIGSCAAPLGDAVPNLALQGAPYPLLSPTSQAWVLERSSYSEHHVTQGRYLAELVRLGEKTSPDIEQERSAKLRATIGRVKSETYALLREEGVAVPTLLVWGLEDPIVPLDNALALYRLLQPRQRNAQLRVINRAGNMPFREQPDIFQDMVTSFVAAL